MATIALLSNEKTNIVFSVSRSLVNTIDNVKWESSAQYAQHNRHLKDVLPEFTGTDADKMSFSAYFSVFLGVDPMQEIVKLLNAERSGAVLRFVIGSKAYGKNKWVIDKTSKDLDKFDNKGNLLIAKVNISLTAYAGR